MILILHLSKSHSGRFPFDQNSKTFETGTNGTEFSWERFQKIRKLLNFCMKSELFNRKFRNSQNTSIYGTSHARLSSFLGNSKKRCFIRHWKCSEVQTGIFHQIEIALPINNRAWHGPINTSSLTNF